MKSYNAPLQRRSNQSAGRGPGGSKRTAHSLPVNGPLQDPLQQKVARDLNRTSRVKGLVEMENALNRSSKVATQAKLAAQGPMNVLERGALVKEKQAPAETHPPSNQTGLPDALKSGIEGLSGLAMDDVKVHYNSARPAQLRALAYTQGTNIDVAPGQEKHLPHEAWHVVQQKQGRVKATMQMQGLPVNDDSVLEREADIMGAKAARPRRAVQRKALSEAAAGTSQQTPVQREIRIGPEDHETPVDPNIDALIFEMRQAAFKENDRALLDKLMDEKFLPYIKRKLSGWILPYAPGKHKAQFRHYESYYELALAVVGQVESTDNRVIEKRLASETAESKYIHQQLQAVCNKLLNKITEDSPLAEALRQPAQGRYGRQFSKDKNLELLEQAAKNESAPFPILVVAIHDMTDPKAVVQQLRKGGLTKNFPSDSRTNTAREELKADTREARRNKTPVEGGLSHTTNRMLALAQWAGAGTAELEAVAWGIFAFWKIFYDKTQTGKHTFDEVMTVAQMYGVPYVRYQYPSQPPPDAWTRGPLIAAAEASPIPKKQIDISKFVGGSARL